MLPLNTPTWVDTLKITMQKQQIKDIKCQSQLETMEP